MQRTGMGYVSRWRQIQARLNFARCKPVPTWTCRHSSDNKKQKNDKLSKKPGIRIFQAAGTALGTALPVSYCLLGKQRACSKSVLGTTVQPSL